MDNKKYIKELFEIVSSDSILIIDKDNQLIRLNVPFTVLVAFKVPGLSLGDIKSVTAIRMSIDLINVYIVDNKPYYHYNFILWIEKGNTDPESES